MGAIDAIQLESIAHYFARGLTAFGAPVPQRLDQWSAENFYLSAESSYVEGYWQAWPFQTAILACMSNDDIREIDFIKSARVGYTKMLLAAIGYNAHHRRRNQAIWQPTDDDRDEFVKTELEPMLRDVPVMQEVFPSYLARHKDNTLQGKKFLGSMLHLRGGKAAKNYRRISVDNAYLDELDAFDNDVEKEGDPVTLAAKRIEGATFGKLICGSTPKTRGFSLIESRAQLADKFFRYHVPCPECGTFHPLTWGGKEESHGFKWQDNNPDTVRHLCPACGCLIDQGQYLSVWKGGRYQAECGTTLDQAGIFRTPDGELAPPPRHIAFHIWTSYSPAASWPDIVREFLAANERLEHGDKSKLKAFRNTTLGETWEEDVERIDADELKEKAEPFPLEMVPMGGLMLLAGIDTQDNRLEVKVWAYGRGCESWSIDHRVFFGSPGDDDVWHDLEDYLFASDFIHASGAHLKIFAAAIDTGGHFTHSVYAWVARMHKAGRKVYAVKGSSTREKHIKNGAQKVDIDWRGRLHKRGLILWHVGTNLAKDLFHSRRQLSKFGPGYVHLSKNLSDETFRQLAGEVRTGRTTARGEESKWVPIRKRVEALDCTVYAIWLETHLDLARKGKKFWDDLEAKVQPAVGDLFDSRPAEKIPELEVQKSMIAEQVRQKPKRRSGGFVKGWK